MVDAVGGLARSRTAGFLWQFLANRRRGDHATSIPASKLPMIGEAVVAACDTLDGVRDGIVDDPRSCRFDPTALQCKAGDEPGCLTSEQVGALNKMYAGARNPRTGEQIYPGWPKSSEALTVAPNGQPQSGWQQYWGTAEPTRVNQGWQDPVVNAIDTIAYYERVRARQGSRQEIDRFFRLFMVPGMGHCSGGPGATSFDALAALDTWVEKGVPPDRIIASRVVDGAVVRTRPLCPFPQKAVYVGSGSTDVAGNFACRSHILRGFVFAAVAGAPVFVPAAWPA